MGKCKDIECPNYNKNEDNGCRLLKPIKAIHCDYKNPLIEKEAESSVLFSAGLSCPDDKEIEQIASDESQQDWNDLRFAAVHREAFIAGAKWMRDKTDADKNKGLEEIEDVCDEMHVPGDCPLCGAAR